MQITVNDPIERVEFIGEVLETKDLDDNAELVIVQIPELGKLSIVLWPDGEMFSTTDWQGMQPTEADKVAEYEWMDLETGLRAVILGGLPRKLIG